MGGLEEGGIEERGMKEEEGMKEDGGEIAAEGEVKEGEGALGLEETEEGALAGWDSGEPKMKSSSSEEVDFRFFFFKSALASCKLISCMFCSGMKPFLRDSDGGTSSLGFG